MKKTYVVYKIENNLNGKIYIGSTNNVKVRFSHHKGLLLKNKHHNMHLQNAVNKDGLNNFSFNVVEEIINEKLLILQEQHWIDYYKSNDRNFGYNLDTAHRHLHSEETKNKIKKIWENKINNGYIHPSKGKKRKPCSEETKKKLSIIRKNYYINGGIHPSKGLIVSKETRKKQSKTRKELFKNGFINPFFGKHHLKKTKNKLKNLWKLKTDNGYISPNKGKKRNEETKKKMKENHANFKGKNSVRWINFSDRILEKIYKLRKLKVSWNKISNKLNISISTAKRRYLLVSDKII